MSAVPGRLGAERGPARRAATAARARPAPDAVAAAGLAPLAFAQPAARPASGGAAIRLASASAPGPHATETCR